MRFADAAITETGSSGFASASARRRLRSSSLATCLFAVHHGFFAGGGAGAGAGAPGEKITGYTTVTNPLSG